MGTSLASPKAERGYRPTLANRQCEPGDPVKWVWERPITFDEFVDLFTGREELVELIGGVVAEKNMVQRDHERLFIWLIRLLAGYVEELQLGEVLGSRTAVRINAFDARLPDIIFVGRNNPSAVEQKSVVGSPDLIIEIASPGDRPSDARALEADYRSIGAAEIVFIDMRRRRVRLLRRTEEGYTEETLTGGALEFVSVPGIHIPLDWLFDEPRPAIHATLDRLRSGRDTRG